MHILLTTYGLILVMSLFAMAQWRQAENLSYFDVAARDVFTSSRSKTFELISINSKNAYHKLKPHPKKKEETTIDDEDTEEVLDQPDTLNDTVEKKPRKRRSSFLHLSYLFNDDNATITEGKGRTCFMLLKNLISELYSRQDFFKDAKDMYPDLEEQFILNLMEKAKERLQKGYSMRAARQLGRLNLDDEIQSYVRYKMLTGNKSRSRNDKNEDPGYFPLIEFVSMKENNHLASLWLAPRPLLMALFQNEDVVEEVVKARYEIHNELRKDKNKSTQDAKTNDLKLRFSSYLSGIDPNFIDFEVSRTYPKE